MKKSNFLFFACKYLFLFFLVQELVIILHNQLKFFNKKRLFRVIDTLFITN